jgi:two-component system OmpR family sensor kinase
MRRDAEIEISEVPNPGGVSEPWDPNAETLNGDGSFDATSEQYSAPPAAYNAEVDDAEAPDRPIFIAPVGPPADGMFGPGDPPGLSQGSGPYPASELPPTGGATRGEYHPGSFDGDAAALPPANRWRYLPRTLGSRLVVGVVALVILLVLLISASTYFALRSSLLSRLDQQVSQLAGGNATMLSNCIGGGGTQCPLYRASYRSAQTEWLLLVDGSGQSLLTLPTTPDLAPMQLSAGQIRSLVAKPTPARTLTTQDGKQLRVIGTRVAANDVTLITGLSTADVNRTLHRLLLLDLSIGAGAVLLALFATSYGVRLSLRPLKRVTATAREVTAELSPTGAGLDRRVPVSPTDTDTETGQLAESMNTLLSAVETQFAARVESEERMRQFMADASHELRTPLTSIRGYAELARMRRGLPGSDQADDDTLDRIESEGTRMSRLVEDLLLLARGDQGAQPHRDVVDVGELVDDAVAGARASFPQRQIEIVVPAPVEVYGDRDQLLRVLRNLVTNAAVHTRPDGPIRVGAVLDGDGVLLRVDDSGPGLPPEEAAHVFERFWRADKARTRARGGTGLGMAIVASIVAAHQGTVRFDSAVETGSTVTVRLPRGPIMPSAEPGGPLEIPGPAGEIE